MPIAGAEGLAKTADRSPIRDVLEGCYFSIDRRDLEGIGSCCADDVIVTSKIPDWKAVHGRERLVRAFSAMIEGGVLGRNSSHTFSNVQVSASDDI